jgi:hypothetical protein
MAIDINIGSKLDGKGFKKAETALDKLNAQGKNLAKTFGYAFGTAAVLRYAKNAAQAFANDEKAAASLAKTLENLGLGFGGSAKEVNDYISNLEKQTGVLDDELRPAMDRLLRATSSITESQKLLSLALDISAGTGKSLTQVSQSLQKALLGQTAALGRLGVGLTKAELASGDFEVIQARLTELFAGQAQTAANGYAGSIAKLQVALNNAAETIGGDLFTAIGTLTGGDGFPKTVQLIETFSSAIGDALIGTSRLIRNIGILASGNPIESIRDLQAVTRADRLADMQERANYGGIYADIYKNQVASNAAQKKSLNTSKALTKESATQLKNKKLQAAIDKAEATLNKGTTIFDLDKIQLAAAEKGQIEQLSKTTNTAQLLAITNDLARLQIKKDIIALEDAIASKDEAAITAATNKLNADLKIYGALTNQEIKLTEIKSILDKIVPKDLINLENLYTAIDLLGQINKTPISTQATATATETTKILTNAQVNDLLVAGSFVPVVAGTGGVMGGSSNAGAYASSGFPGSDKGYGTPVNITVNTGIGDPNAIAEAVVTVINDAARRGTLTGVMGIE